MTESLTLFLCGDVMLGRGIDQILPHPGDPRLQETYVGSAKKLCPAGRTGDRPDPGAGRFFLLRSQLTFIF